MKIINFIIWNWRKMTAWQRMFALAFFFLGAAIASNDDKIAAVLALVSAAIFLAHMFKWMIWDAIGESWKMYHEEQQKIVDIMKDDHQ
jgi:membrane protein DedA with SNARE-associated domain